MKIANLELSPRLRKDLSLIEFINNVASILNSGRYQMRTYTAVPTHTGESGEFGIFISGTVLRLYVWDDTNSLWYFNEWNAVGLGQATIVKSVALTAQDGDITTTTLYTPAAAGVYRISTYALTTTAGAGGTLDVTIGWTDSEQAQSSVVVNDLDLTVDKSASQNTLFVRATAAAITYATAITGKSGTPAYSLFIIVERLS